MTGPSAYTLTAVEVDKFGREVLARRFDVTVPAGVPVEVALSDEVVRGYGAAAVREVAGLRGMVPAEDVTVRVHEPAEPATGRGCVVVVEVEFVAVPVGDDPVAIVAARTGALELPATVERVPA